MGTLASLPTAAAGRRVTAKRLVDRPIIVPHMDGRMGGNVEGPSLIRAPDWLPGRLGRYYLYFADHKGDYIRLAYADRLTGPWTMHEAGALPLSRSGLPTAAPLPPATPPPPARLGGRDLFAPPGTPGIPTREQDATLPHLASPDVHVDAAGKRIVMYFHGLSGFARQQTRVAASPDGIGFTPIGTADLAPPYLRAVRVGGFVYAMAMPGILLRSVDGVTPFERGPAPFGEDQRHVALLVHGDELLVFWTRVGDAPERIYLSRIAMRGDWRGWRAAPPVEVLRPERVWEGTDLPIRPSYRSAVNLPVNQLRDPAVFVEDGTAYLLYAVKGEGGIGISRLDGLGRVADSTPVFGA